jgi:hypothetical protein
MVQFGLLSYQSFHARIICRIFDKEAKKSGARQRTGGDASKNPDSLELAMLVHGRPCCTAMM